MSRLSSPFQSPTATSKTFDPAWKVWAAWNVPSPFPARRSTRPLLSREWPPSLLFRHRSCHRTRCRRSCESATERVRRLWRKSAVTNAGSNTDTGSIVLVDRPSRPVYSSPFRSATSTPAGLELTADRVCHPHLGRRYPNRLAQVLPRSAKQDQNLRPHCRSILLPLSVAKSTIPSPLRSPVTTAPGNDPVA